MREQLLDYLAERNPIHGKKIVKNLESVAGMKDELGWFLKMYAPYMERRVITLTQLADAYLTMVDQMSAARFDFVRTGKYPSPNQETAVADVYANPHVMGEYMLGLALSQFLWKHHYRLFTFYRQHVRTLAAPIAALEVGSGHGLFLLELVTAQPDMQVLDVVDISATSLQLTNALLQSIRPDLAQTVHFLHSDIAHFSPDRRYDFITMGEVLEHVPDPGATLAILKRLLAPGGKMFISTCANCPTIDHIYYFQTADDIRELIVSEGLRIESEVVAPSEDLSDEQLRKHRLDILYGAILTAS